MYTIRLNRTPYLVSCAGRALPWQVQDVSPERHGQKILERYIADAWSLFQQEAAILIDMHREFTAVDAKRLEKFFAIILDARKGWQEEESSIQNKK